MVTDATFCPTDGTLLRDRSPNTDDVTRRIVCRGLMGGLLLWLAFPPVGWWPLAWVALVYWIDIAAQPMAFQSRQYRFLYLIGFFHWLLMLQWVRLPHYSAWFGWIVLAGYLGLYLPLWVAVVRALLRVRFPLVVAAPLTWAALEWLRGRLFTGFALDLLGHSLALQPHWIQIADWGGAESVGYLLVTSSVLLFEMVRSRVSWRSLVMCVALIAVNVAVVIYGSFRIHDTSYVAGDGPDDVQVALIQGCIDTSFGVDQAAPETIESDYRRLTRKMLMEQRSAGKPVPDLIVWPESMYPWMLGEADPEARYPTGIEEVNQVTWHEYRTELTRQQVQSIASQSPSNWLVGVHWNRSTAENKTERFNSALHIDRSLEIAGRYDKMHPVMFGEYVPGGNCFPWLYRLTPMDSGLTAGKRPIAIDVQGASMSPCICFENTVPHLIARQIRELDRHGKPPVALITITNDGWFWGSSLLDVHLACGIFRSIEHRCTGLIAANTGFSAWVDRAGRLLARGPRRGEGAIIASVPRAETPHTLYRRWGDWFGKLAAAIVGLGLIAKRFVASA